MGLPAELAELDATAQAELVRRRDVTALGLVDAAIANIERLDGHLNAVVHRRFEQARAEAKTRLVPVAHGNDGAARSGSPRRVAGSWD